MKILVTGATGFLGSAMMSRLERTNSVQPIAGVRQITSLPDQRAAQIVMGDMVGDPPEVEVLANIDCIIHCAARVHIMNDALKDPISAFRAVNVTGTLKLAEQAAKAGVRRFVFVSSIKVNGESTAVNEKYTPDDQVDPQEPYARSKFEAENALMELARSSDMEVVIVRSPLVYGAGVGANFLSILRWVDKEVPLPLLDTQNLRSLVFVENLTSFLWTCASNPKAANQTFLVSDGEDVSTSVLLQKLAKHLGKSSRLFSLPKPLVLGVAAVIGKKTASDRLFDSLRIDASKNRILLEWVPPFTLDQGLHETAEWFKRRA